MAIGLSNVNGRKAKRVSESKETKPLAVEPAELKVASEAWSTRGLAREGRSVRRERASAAGELNLLWFDWTDRVTGSETPNRVLRTIRQILELEKFVFEFLVYDLEIPARAKKQISEFRARHVLMFQK